ncbi:MAG: hypothetical protein ABIP48_17910 [Planctomycetota bacterium]
MGKVTASSTGSGPELSPVRTYQMHVLPWIDAFIGLQRRHSEGDLAEIFEVDVENDVADRFADWSRGVAALLSAQDLARLSWSSRPPSWCHFGGGSTGLQLSDQDAAEWPEEELETVDWDVRIETLPPRRAQRVVVTFREGAYRVPRIVDDPED